MRATSMRPIEGEGEGCCGQRKAARREGGGDSQGGLYRRDGEERGLVFSFLFYFLLSFSILKLVFVFEFQICSVSLDGCTLKKSSHKNICSGM
jgi:hypothetical protein